MDGFPSVPAAVLFLTVTLQLFVQSIQSLNIGQVSDAFILPAGKNPVRIAKLAFPVDATVREQASVRMSIVNP